MGLEFFCFAGDELWETDDEELVQLGMRELEKLGLAKREQLEFGFVERVPKAYPMYDAEYDKRVTTIRSWLDGLDNYIQVGRNGLHRYNNSDHSMLTAMRAVDNLVTGADHDIWAVNAESAYHEEGKDNEEKQPYIEAPETEAMKEPLHSEVPLSGGSARARGRVSSRGVECAARGVAGRAGRRRRAARLGRGAAGGAGGGRPAASRRRAVPYIAASAVSGALSISCCWRGRTTAVRVSVVYPIARGSAPVVVLVFSAIALKEGVPAGAVVGHAPRRRGSPPRGVRRFSFPFRKGKRLPLRDVWFGLAIGAVIASYTLVDSEGVERADPIAYLALVVAPCAVVYPFVAKVRPDVGRRSALPPRPPSAPSSWCSRRSGSPRPRRWPP